MSDNKIPKCPRENRIRLESILAGQKKKLEKRKELLKKIAEKKENILKMVSSDKSAVEKGAEKTDEMFTRETILKKRVFDYDRLVNQIKTLQGKIRWNEEDQLPFVRHLEAEAVENGELEPLTETTALVAAD